MAVISKEEQRVAGVLFMVQVRVLADGKFRIKYPGFMATDTGELEAVSDSLEGVRTLFWAKVKAYEESAKETRRIIVYKIEHNSPRTSAGHCKWLRSAKGVMIEIQAQVLDMTVLTSGDKKSYGYEIVLDDTQLPEGLREGIPTPCNRPPGRHLRYTPQRREFFVKFYEAMEELIARMARIDDPEELALAIDNGVNLLEAPE